MSLITPDYRILQERLHAERPDYGTSSGKYVEQVRAIAEQLKTRDILDYGCGKGLLARGLPFPIQNYDPCVGEFNRRPDPADFVVCTDVLEHIEPSCIDEVLDDLQRLTKKTLLLNVACRPAKKFLADGRNAHIIQQTPNWWLGKLLPRFALHSFQATAGDFTAIFFAHDVAGDAEGDEGAPC